MDRRKSGTLLEFWMCGIFYTVLGPRAKNKTSIKAPVDERPDGWLWQLGKLTKMTDVEMEEWSSEGKPNSLE